MIDGESGYTILVILNKKTGLLRNTSLYIPSTRKSITKQGLRVKNEEKTYILSSDSKVLC